MSSGNPKLQVIATPDAPAAIVGLGKLCKLTTKGMR